METIAIQTASANLTEEQFFCLCADNKELRIERDKNKNIIVMSPTGSLTGSLHADILRQLANWNYKYKFGKVFDSSAGFTLPNSAVRAADVAWIAKERWEKVPQKDKERFAHICPDFVIEVLSKTDSLKATKEKMEEWIINGCRLAWLIDINKKTVYVYKPNAAIEIKNFAQQLSGEDVLPKFKLDLVK